MTGPEHSKKSKTVTIDLEADAVHEVKSDSTTEAADEPAAVAFETAPATETPPSPVTPNTSGGSLGKLSAGLVGGLIALIGGAGLQYAGQLPSFGGNEEMSALKAEVAALSSAPSIDPAVLEALTKQQSDLATQLTAITTAVETLKSSASGTDGAAITAVEEKLASLEDKIAGFAGSGAAADPASSAAFIALSEKVAALEAKPADAGDAKSVATAIAASGLKAAIDRGGSFTNELETYASIVPNSPDVEALRALAASGVPSQQALLADFGDAATAMIDAAVVPDPEMGILQRLTQSAKSLVKARRVGDIEGDEPDAVVARMEIALQRGDLAAVLTQSEKLPEASKVAGKPFLDKVTARRDTDTLVTRALGLALMQAGGKS